jgi:hypothetical protein
MHLLSEITVSNFRCFRRLTTLRLGGATYLVGANNAGKTAFLSALQCFFDSNAYTPDFLNRTELAARGRGANRSVIAVTFDLQAIRGKTFRKQLIDEYGEEFTIAKIFVTAEISRETSVYYHLRPTSRLVAPRDLPEALKKLLQSVSISYIHPQEGGTLLQKAQAKLKTRLFQNWGRHVTVANRLKRLQGSWDELRKTANNYLSSSLTENVRNVWPSSSVRVDLPAKIEDVVAISDILFQGSRNLPDIPLTAQGTGAQSTVLYHAHYLLDSDRSLHRGPYSPVWLLEEPESFLHADLAVKLGTLLNSTAWLDNIQMVISTHSPHILATSKANDEIIEWALLADHSVIKSKRVREWTFDEVVQMGGAMGDTNFDAYFYASGLGSRLFIEDTRPLTKTRFVEAGFEVERALSGTSEVRKYVDVFRNLGELVKSQCFFLIDNDRGKRAFSDIIATAQPVEEEEHFSLLRISKNVFFVVMPPDFAAEDLFDEFADTLSVCTDALFDDELRPAGTVPGHLSRAHAAVRRQVKPTSRTDAMMIIRNEQDVKDTFWKAVERDGYHIADRYVAAIRGLMERAANAA